MIPGQGTKIPSAAWRDSGRKKKKTHLQTGGEKDHTGRLGAGQSFNATCHQLSLPSKGLFPSGPQTESCRPPPKSCTVGAATERNLRLGRGLPKAEPAPKLGWRAETLNLSHKMTNPHTLYTTHPHPPRHTQFTQSRDRHIQQTHS